MRAAAVVIGVNNTGYLQALDGAVPGAEDFARWAETQKIEVTLITDKDGERVTLKRVRDTIRIITDALVYKKLIVFFSGHGFLLSPQSELWLLSESPDPETEAVNVRLSAEFARYCGIPHIIFVSDACRSGGPTHRHRAVTGGAIFPNLQTNSDAAEIDFFYATRPGDTALEVNNENEAVVNYKGIFTECLLHALRGNVPEVVKEIEKGHRIHWLIPSHSLKKHLKDAVPLKAQDVNITLNQRPEVRAESHLPLFFGQLDYTPTPSSGIRVPPSEPELRDFVEHVQDEIMSFIPTTNIAPQLTNSETDRLFSDQMKRISLSRGRGHFETTTGFTVYGRLKSAIVGNDVQSDIFEVDEVTHVRVHEHGDNAARSILLELESGLGTVLAVKHGFIATVLLENEQVINVNYTPSDNTPDFYDEYMDEADRIERRRAFAAAATRHGVFELNSDEAEYAGDYLRMMKRLDPTLGLYAAYAYSQAGRIDKVRSVLWHMMNYPPIPFDVLLLARDPRAWNDPEAIPAPFCPMLRQGWTLLDLHPESSVALRDFRRLITPSLWTMFSPEGVDRVRIALTNGDFS